MAKNTDTIPFTELVERVSELGRIRPEVERKVRGIVNDIYSREIPRKEDWSFLLRSSSITLTAEFNDGTVAANTGGTAVDMTDATITAAMTGRKIKISGNDYVYEFTFTSSSGGTINPPLSGTQNVSGASYSIFQPSYNLSPTFERFPKNGGLYSYSGGQRTIIPEVSVYEFNANYTPTPNSTPTMCRVYGQDTAGTQQVEINPPPKDAISLEYTYYETLLPMRETTAGFCTVNSSQTTVTGSAGTTRFTEARTGDWFRIDAFGTGADSEWYQILSITNNSSLTLATSFGLSGAGTVGYTICSAPRYPVRLHPAVLYGALTQIAADQNDTSVAAYNLRYAEVLSDGKRLYKTRMYQQDIASVAEDYLYRR